ncbi:hypothetical protein DFH27DRAFT_117750 [Peziza echinospora]|nr:hypothetical protein DFH27DRAFT_117750 [Peziza echinospora]
MSTSASDSRPPPSRLILSPGSLPALIPDDSPLLHNWQPIRVKLENAVPQLGRRYQAPDRMVEILDAFIRYTPPLELASRLQTLQEWALEVEMRELFKKAVCLAQVLHYGLQAAVTRIGSRGNSSTETPPWLLSSNIAPVPQVPAMPAIPVQYPREPSQVTLCKQRDCNRCAITGSLIIEVVHIIPYSSASWSNAFEFSALWHFIRAWIGNDNARKLWEYVGYDNVNRLENLLTLCPNEHRLFGDGKLLLEPVRTYHRDNLAMLEIMKVEILGPIEPVGTLYPPVDPAIVNITTADLTGMRMICAPRLLQSGSLVAFVTEDPNNLPLPNTHLLELLTAISRVRKMAGMATPEILETFNDPEPPIMTMTPKEHATVLARKLANLAVKQDKGSPVWKRKAVD